MHESPTWKSDTVSTAFDHKKYVRLSIQLNRWLLNTIGAWPRSVGSSVINKYAKVLLNVCGTGLIAFLFIPCSVFLVLEMEDVYGKLRLCGPLSFCIMIIVKYYSLILHGSDIRRCVEHIEKDWMNTQHKGDHAIMVRNAEFGRRLVMICTFFSYGGIVFYHIAMPISNGKITEEEEDRNLTYRPLVYPVPRTILDTRQSPVSEIFFWVQFLAAVFAQAVTSGCCGLAAVCAMHTYGRLEVLMEWMVHLVDGREDICQDLDKRLAMIVEHHVRILHFVALTEKILREISLVEIVGCTLNMCFIGYFIITEWARNEYANYVTFATLLLSFTFNIFMFCYFGELVTEQCRKVSEISYMIDWYRLPERRGLAIILVIAMSNSSIKLTAGNLIELSLSSFGDVIKTSLAYLNMLRTLTS